MADFDGDGNPDLAGISNGLAVSVEKGHGSFQPPVAFSSPSSEAVGVTADLNRDNAPDVVIININEDPISISSQPYLTTIKEVADLPHAQ